MIKPQYSNILFQFVYAIKSAFGDFQNYQTLTPSLYYTVLSKSPILMYAFYNETLVRFSFVTQACPISKKEEGYTSCRRYCMVYLFKSKPGRLCSLRHSPHVFCHVLSGNFCSFVCLFKGPHFYARIGVGEEPDAMESPILPDTGTYRVSTTMCGMHGCNRHLRATWVEKQILHDDQC